MNMSCGGDALTAPAPAAAAPPGATILVVDDHPANLGFVVDSLEQRGYRVIVAQDGAEALRRVAFARPDLILLDAMMPGMDGFEVCRRLKLLDGGREPPVIFMTALQQTESKLSAFALGAVDYVTKPLRVDEVLARVDTHLELRAARQRLQRQTQQLQQVQAGLRDELACGSAALSDSRRLLQGELAGRRAAELELQASALRYEEVFDHVSDALFLLEADGQGQFRYVDANPAFVKLAGGARGDIVGRAADAMFGAGHAARLRAAFLRCVGGGAVLEDEVEAELAQGRRAIALAMVPSRVPGRGGSRLVGIARDVTGLRESQARLHYQASRDALTGLPNRMHFRTRLTQAIARAGQAGVGVLLLDLDNFRDINEALGHACGDSVLRAHAALLCAAVGGGDMVARTGGNEFAVLVEPAGDGAALAALARRLLDLLARSGAVDGNEVVVNCSAGIACYPADADSAEALLCNVDTALYRAKAEGGNRYQVFTAEMNHATRRRLELGKALRHAVRLGEFSLHYQPRASLVDGAAVGMEALLRWNSAQLGPVGPAEFIPLAEQNGMIVEIGNWVLEQACRQARLWLDSMPAPLPVAVNLSARQFRDADLAGVVAAALRRSGLPPQLLELELTESMLMHDARHASATLNALKALGVRLAIDDFGTGYSSLSYLKSFPLDYLKIDRSFIGDLPGGASDAAIVRAIIVMAHALGLKVIAEGVETAAQLAFLREQRCDEIQGYHFSRPLIAADMDACLCRPGDRLTLRLD